MWRFLLFFLVAACAQPRLVVRSEPFDFGGARATVRQFPRDAICEAEPRFLLDELSSVNGLLSRFLRDVPRGPDAEWSEASIGLVEDAGERLPPLLGLHGKSLDSVGRCEFAKTGAWPELIKRGRTLIDDTRSRLESAPAEVATVRKARALEAWRRDRLAQQESARRACPQRLGRTIIYFAWREGGVTTWLFCDGAQLTREGAGRPQLEAAPAELSRRRRPSEGSYLTAMGRYPAAAVLTPPGDGAVSAW